MDFSNLDFKFKEIADDRVLSLLGKIGQALVKIYQNMPKTVVLPKIFQVKGEVEVTKPVKVSNLAEVVVELQRLSERLTVFAQAASTAKPAKIEFPKFEIPKQQAASVDMQPTIDAINALGEQFNKQPVDDTSVSILRKMNKTLEEFVSRPVMTPQPVTNISINGLQGFGHSTAQIVGTNRTSLPAYGQLFNRRSLIIFNNSSSNTLYLGGSDVTSSNGLPVLPNSYSPAIDAGYDLIIYGVASGGTDVRVFEVSKDQTQNVQE